MLDSRSHGKSQLGDAHFEAIEEGKYGRIHASTECERRERTSDIDGRAGAGFKQLQFSFPTIQMEIISPMMGLVPFDVKPVRLKIGGVIAAGDHATNDVYIPVTKPGFAARRISFQRLWDVLNNSTSVTIDSTLVRDMREKIRCRLDC